MYRVILIFSQNKTHRLGRLDGRFSDIGRWVHSRFERPAGVYVILRLFWKTKKKNSQTCFLLPRFYQSKLVNTAMRVLGYGLSGTRTSRNIKIILWCFELRLYKYCTSVNSLSEYRFLHSCNWSICSIITMLYVDTYTNIILKGKIFWQKGTFSTLNKKLINSKVNNLRYF